PEPTAKPGTDGQMKAGRPVRRDGAVGGPRQHGAMTTVERVRAVALCLPRSYEALVRDRVKFRVGRIVFLAFSRDEEVMGFGFPKEERAAMVAAEPEK